MRTNGAGEFEYTHANTTALPFPDSAFDAVVVLLVFEHIEQYREAIGEIARVLEPGGRFAFFLNHPLLQAPNSGWVIDHILEEEYWRVGPYLIRNVTNEELAPGVVLPFIHRPLSQYVNALADHGLLVERMEEQAPPPASSPGPPGPRRPRRFRDCCSFRRASSRDVEHALARAPHSEVVSSTTI